MIAFQYHVDDGYLKLDVIKQPAGKTLYDFDIMKLEPDELDLDANRFARFSLSPQTYDVQVESCEPLTVVTPVYLAWIKDNCRSAWSFRHGVHHVGLITAEFSFAEGWEAAFFSLTFNNANMEILHD